ncbi:hypothetical protein HZ326_28756 [Fusarium oxysporum f. sp. albedinis]|nr:hypothetical protein HZ326_28756 [Fusarium oxysporum f. sp. albedinis]
MLRGHRYLEEPVSALIGSAPRTRWQPGVTYNISHQHNQSHAPRYPLPNIETTRSPHSSRNENVSSASPSPLKRIPR